MATTTIIPLHAGKNKAIRTALGLSINYVENPEKTDGGEWITSYECDPLIADAEFLFSKRQYVAITGREQGERDVIGYHLRISFRPGETDARTANRIGYDLAMKLTKGNHAFVCCTHVDKKHVHSHVVINSTSLDCTRKFHNFKGSSFAVRRIADQLCLENGLSVIEKPKPSKGKSYGKWMGSEKSPGARDKLRELIDTLSEQGKDFPSFLSAMKAAGCEVKQGKHLAFKMPGGKKFIRCDSLGDAYTPDAILKRLSGKQALAKMSKPKPFAPLKNENRLSLLIDIQAKIQEGKGANYEQWAKIFNLKQAAKTLLFLSKNGIDSYDALAEKSAVASADFDRLSERIKSIDKRLGEISELQKQIGTYGKTREIYAQYKASGWDKDFYEQFRADITLHKSAKKYFNSLALKKLPSISSLKQEYAILVAEKKKLYQGYRKMKERHIDLLVAKDTCERLLGINQNMSERKAVHEQKRHQPHSR